MKIGTHAQKNIAFTGGGSGGHVLPIASLIEYAEQDKEIQGQGLYNNLYWFGEVGGLEQTKSDLFSSVQFVPIQSGKIRRYITIESILLSIRDFFRLLIGLLQSARYLKKYRITKVFCKGGYVAIPVCIAAKVLHIPIVVHESDTHAGLANRVAATMATTIFTGFSQVFDNSFTVGQILSLSLSTPKEIPLVGFDSEKTTVLVMGGSQGAKTLFALLPSLVETYGDILQFIVLTGLLNKERTEKLKEYKVVFPLGFLDQQQLAYILGLCDISITRGSATSLEEQHVFGLKKIIVPLPFTGGNHQEVNADRYIKERGDVKVLQNDELLKNISLELKKHTKYKKENSTIDVDKITSAHKAIWSSLLDVDKNGK